VQPLAERMGFTMKLPPVQPRTRLAHALAIWAADNGEFNAFNTAVFKTFFQDGLDIGRLEILFQIVASIGLNSKELESGSRIDSYIQRVIDDERMARQAGIRGVPAYVVYNKVLATGVQSLAQLQQLFQLL
jgi:predicted DsbA family dithiol-disulfide isomerase